MRIRAWALLVALVATIVAVALVASGDAASAPSVSPFRGLGTWVDVYDYGPEFQGDGGPPAVLPASVDDMADLGVRTIYLQAAQDDDRSDGLIVDRDLVGQFLRRAHRNGIRVVAWYLPHFADVERDLRHIRALARFRAGGERFDGIALDIEWTNDVEDVAARNRALIEVAERSRDRVGDATPLGAIVLEPVLIEDVNPLYWPEFPWKRLEDSFDVWLPMSYWTNRSESSGWKDGFRYTRENIRRVRQHLEDPDANVHAIGGIGDTSSAGDYEGFVRASERGRAIGWSVYDYATTSSSAWPRLRG
jgi:hypothetical protein